VSESSGSRPELVRFADHFWWEYQRKIEAAVGALTDEQVWWRPNEASNSIANLLVHLDGNLSQWVLEGLGGVPYERHRDAEFGARGGATKAELLARLEGTVGRCREAVARLGAGDLARVRRIQTYELDGAAALFHAVEHMSYHTGQIVLLAKWLGAALDFYPQHRGE
jgi:uncharacterized damage-inducible protein DinB